MVLVENILKHPAGGQSNFHSTDIFLCHIKQIYA